MTGPDSPTTGPEHPTTGPEHPTTGPAADPASHQPRHPAERVMAPFAGEGAGDEPLAWGQHEIFLAMTQQQSWFPLGGTNPLPPERTVEEVAAELSYLLGRYQTMRTRLRFAADGSPRQVVASAGEIALEVVDALDDDPAEVAELLRRRYAETDYSFVDEWPVRMGVVRSHGVLTHQVSIVCHLVTDSSG
jgi:hypothetical protein